MDGLWAGPALVVAGTGAALWAVRGERRSAYRFAKAAASLGFVTTALGAGALRQTWGSIALAALVTAAVGDVLLAGSGRRSFLAGLGAFALAHVLYMAAFVARGVAAWTLALGVLVAGAFLAGAWRWLRPHVSSAWLAPVSAYAVVLGLMLATGLATAIASGTPMLAAGAMLVAGSDAAVARHRFVQPAFANKLWGLPSYYLGQTLIALVTGR